MRDLLTRLHALDPADPAALHDLLAELVAQVLGARAVVSALAAGETLDEDTAREWVFATAGTAEIEVERTGPGATIEQRAEAIAVEIVRTLPSNN